MGDFIASLAQVLVERLAGGACNTDYWTRGNDAATAEACGLEFRGLFSETRGRNVLRGSPDPGIPAPIVRLIAKAIRSPAADAANQALFEPPSESSGQD